MTRQEPTPPPPTRAAGREERWRAAGLCLVLAAITWLVFGQAAGFKFINCDDDVYVYENARVAGGLSLRGLAAVFTHADCNLYHPLTMLSLMADYQFHGLQAGGYHLTNVLLHTASVLLLFLVLLQMTGALWRSAFVAAVFAVHPLRAESVAWVAERKDVLSAFFFMLTLGAYVRYVRKPGSPGRYLTVAAAFVAALLCKPTVVTLPFLLLLLDYWPLHRAESARRLALEKLPLLALAAGACAMTVLAAGAGIATRAHVSMQARLGNALISYVIYLRQMVWPEGLAPFYPLPAGGWPLWSVALSFFLLALITAGVLASRRKRPWLLAGWLWYLGMLTPMIGLVQVGAFAHADRMTYLPQIGLYLLLTWAAADLSAPWRYGRMAPGGLAVIALCALIFCARNQAAYWRDNETLWSHALACTTGSDVADNNLGYALFKNGKVDEAISLFQKALQLNPAYLDARNNLGSALLQKGRVDEAIAQYQKALQLNPGYAEAHYNLGLALAQNGSVHEAILQDQKALEIKPDYADAHINLGVLLLQMGNPDEAAGHFQSALRIRPDSANAHGDLGIALFRMGKVDEAITHFQRALQSAPDSANFHVNLATALLKNGKPDEAIGHLQQALRLEADSADACYGLGNAFAQKGKTAAAIAQYRRALQLKPDNAEAQNNLAWLLGTCPEASLRNGNEAVKLARQANALTGGGSPIILHTLAAALAETGRFGDARESAQKAIALAAAAGRRDLLEEFNDELKHYQAGLPLHQ